MGHNMNEIAMAHTGQAILSFQVHLTAIMTLVAGMPHFVCRCPSDLAKDDDSRPAAQATACCCCGSCGSTLGAEQKESEGKPFCCSQKSFRTSKTATGSHQAAGGDCTKVTGLPKVPAVSTIRPARPIDVSSCVGAASLAVISPTLHAERQDSASRWTGHSPAPPTDRVISLQRFLI
jgi:hypothetical protein